MPPFETERLSDDRGVAVAGGWLLPAPSRTLRVAALAFEVFRRRRAGTDPPLRKNRNRADPQALAPLQSSHCCPWSNSTSSRGIRPALRSETATFAAARFGRRPPLHRPRNARARPESSPPSVHSCVRCRTLRSQGAIPETRSVLVVSHHLDGFLRSEVAGLLHPAAGHGVRRVSGSRIPDPRPGKPDRGGRTDTFLATHFTPPEGTLDCSRTTSPWPLPPCRWPTIPLDSPFLRRCQRHPVELRMIEGLDFEAFLRRRVWTLHNRFQSRGARPSMGFVPLRGPSRRAQALMPPLVVPLMTKIRRKPSVAATSSVPHLQRPYAEAHTRSPCGARMQGVTPTA